MEWGRHKANEGAKRQMGCQKANGVPTGKWVTKRQTRRQKANEVPKGKWIAKRQMGHQKANRVLDDQYHLIKGNALGAERQMGHTWFDPG